MPPRRNADDSRHLNISTCCIFSGNILTIPFDGLVSVNGDQRIDAVNGGELASGARYSVVMERGVVLSTVEGEFVGIPASGQGSYSFTVAPDWYWVFMLIAVALILVIGVPTLIYSGRKAVDCFNDWHLGHTVRHCSRECSCRDDALACRPPRCLSFEDTSSDEDEEGEERDLVSSRRQWITAKSRVPSISLRQSEAPEPGEQAFEEVDEEDEARLDDLRKALSNASLVTGSPAGPRGAADGDPPAAPGCASNEQAQ